MVSIRLQRRGRRRAAHFRMVVQDARQAPASGRVIANLGFYNPHTKEHAVDLDKAVYYLSNGAQPSPRVVKFLLDNKVKLPDWVNLPAQRQSLTKNTDKLRRHRPLAEATKAPASETDEPAADEPTEPEAASTDDPADQEKEKPVAEDSPASSGKDAKDEKPTEETVDPAPSGKDAEDEKPADETASQVEAEDKDAGKDETEPAKDAEPQA